MNTYTETLAGDGDSALFSVAGQGGFETVAYTLDGAWNGATVTMYVCLDTAASPNVFTAIPSSAFTADTYQTVELPQGALVKATVSGSGSPLPSLVLAMRGDISLA